MKIGHATNDVRTSANRYVRIDRTTPLGNPYRIGVDGNREYVIARYAEYLPRAYTDDPTVRSAIDHLVTMETDGGKPVVLLCWCSPLPCHGNEIIKFVHEKIWKGVHP